MAATTLRATTPCAPGRSPEARALTQGVRSDGQWLRLPAPAPWLVLLVVGLAALAIRLAFLFRAPVFIIGDSENYFWPGYELAREIGFDLELRRTPVYPLFIAFVVRQIGEDLSALALAQHLLGVGTCVLTAWLGLRFWGPWTGLLAGLLAALAGPLLVAEHYVMAEALFIPLALAAVAWLAVTLERDARWPLLVGGLLVGVAALTRPVGLVLAVACGLALLVEGWHREQQPLPALRWALPRGLLLVLGVGMVWWGWSARNLAVHGTFSAEGNAGQTLVGRTMRHDRGFTFEDPAEPDPARRRAREIMQDGRGGFVSPVRNKIQRELDLDEAQANRLMRDLAVDTLRRQPGYYVGGTLANFAGLAQGMPERSRDHWATRREARNREEWEANEAIRHLLGPPTPLQEQQYGEANMLIALYQSYRFGPLLPLLALVGAAGLALGVGTRRARPGAAVFLLLVVVGLLLAAVALVAPIARYRYPTEPLFALLGAGGLATLIQAARCAAARIPPRPGTNPPVPGHSG
ncbi:MAG: glycosyltransferase family 39 protein [Chloroflexi bacterium]|nr:glycosyltransferase family 39 protein [Chloroflexota bacterium]